MSKKTPLILTSIAIVVLIGIFYFVGESNQESIKIGVTLSETGPGSGIGIAVRDGMKMAVDEVNNNGGINGKLLELIILDNQSNKEKAKENFLEIENNHTPLMHVSSLSSISTAVSPLAEEHKVVLMALSATATNVTVDKNWTYRYFPTADIEAVPISRILDGLNVYNFGILYQNDEFGRSVADAVDIASQHPDRSVNREPFDLDVTDFKDHISNLQDTDAIIIVAFPDYVEIILRDIREVNYSGYVIGSSDAVTPNIVSMPEANGVFLAAPSIYNSKFLFASKISDNFEAIYNKQFDHNAANGYDFIKLLDKVLEGEELSRDNVKQILDDGISHLGAFGNISTLPGEHDIAFPLLPAQVIDGKLEFRQ